MGCCLISMPNPQILKHIFLPVGVISIRKRWKTVGKKTCRPAVYFRRCLFTRLFCFSFIWLDVITVRCIFLITLFMLEKALTDAVTFYFHTVEQLLQIPRNFLLVGELKHFFHNIHQSFSRLSLTNYFKTVIRWKRFPSKQRF